MDGTLKTIQKLSKIGKVLSKIVMICAIVGAVGCLIGVITVAAGDEKWFSVGDVNVDIGVVNDAGLTQKQLISVLAVWLVICAAEAVIARFAELYFAHELEAGTPFTLGGADEMKRLGIIIIAVSLGAQIVALIVSAIIGGFSDNGTWNSDILSGGSVGMGIMFLVMSLVTKYGAEREKPAPGQTAETTAAADPPEQKQ